MRPRGGRGAVRGWLTLAAALSLPVRPAAAEAQAAGGPDRDPLAGLHEYVAGAVADWRIAGLSLAVVKDDSVVFAQGFGVRHLGHPEPVDEHTVFAIGSNTKLFTAVAAGMLVDEGRLAWDGKAEDLLPGFQLHDPYVTRELTLADLMAHRSGLGRRGDALWYGTRWSRPEILQRIRHLEPNSSFRAEYGYQNTMFLAAGEVVARAAGRSWDDVIRDRIFAPLGMGASSTSTLHLPSGGNVAQPHQWIDGRLVPVPWRNLDNVAPAGSINASASDMTRWLRLLLGRGALDGRRLVSESALREIETPHTVIPFPGDTLHPSTHFLTYGLGVVAMDYRGEKVLWHTGGIDGMLSLVAYVPRLGLGLVALTNTSGRNNLFTALQYRILDAYLGGPEEDWSRIYLERSREAEARQAEVVGSADGARVPGTSPSLSPEAYEGRYVHPMYGDAVVRLEGGALRVEVGPALQGTLRHWHFDVFRAELDDAVQGHRTVRFALDARGRAAVLAVDGLGDFRRTSGSREGGR